MNKKFKTNLIAILAIFSGTSCGSCFAVQDSSAANPIGSGVVQSSDNTSGGAFGAVVPAVDHSAYFAKKDLPPIVSPGQTESAEMVTTIDFPPIVTPGQANRPEVQAELPPIERASDFPPIERASNFPPIVQADAFVVPVSQMPLPMQVQTNFDQRAVEPMAMPRPMNIPAPLGSSPSYAYDSEFKSPVQNASMLAPIGGGELGGFSQDNDLTMAPPTMMQADAIPQTLDQSTIQQAAQWGPQGHSTNSMSSAGVQLYGDRSTSTPPIFGVSSNTPPPIVNSSPPMLNFAPPTVGRGTQTAIMPPSAPPTVISNQSVMVDQAYMPAETAYNQHYFSAPAVEAPVVTRTQNCSSCGGGSSSCASCSGFSSINSGCSGCGGSGCSDCGIASAIGGGVSNCDSCGTGGCFNPGSVASRFGSSGSVSDARRYLHAEFLYFDRADGSISNSNFGSLSDFDWNAGWRITFGAKSDALRGREISYMGIMPVEQTVTRTDAAARINARFTSNDGFTGAETSAFRNAVSQTEFKETQIHSVEYNQVTWGWDVIKSFVGLRYFYIDDRYMMTSLNDVAETGTFEMSTINHLFGPHIGGELFYDVGYRWSYSMAGKAGVYANVNSVDTKLFNAGAQFMDVSDDSATVSTSLELNLLAHYQLSRTARLRFGYNFLWVGDVASVSDNFNPALSPTAGTNSSDDDDMLFHGPSVGFEIFR